MSIPVDAIMGALRVILGTELGFFCPVYLCCILKLSDDHQANNFDLLVLILGFRCKESPSSNPLQKRKGTKKHSSVQNP